MGGVCRLVVRRTPKKIWAPHGCLMVSHNVVPLLEDSYVGLGIYV